MHVALFPAQAPLPARPTEPRRHPKASPTPHLGARVWQNVTHEGPELPAPRSSRHARGGSQTSATRPALGGAKTPTRSSPCVVADSCPPRSSRPPRPRRLPRSPSSHANPEALATAWHPERGMLAKTCLGPGRGCMQGQRLAQAPTPRWLQACFEAGCQACPVTSVDGGADTFFALLLRPAASDQQPGRSGSNMQMCHRPNGSSVAGPRRRSKNPRGKQPRAAGVGRRALGPVVGTAGLGGSKRPVWAEGTTAGINYTDAHAQDGAHHMADGIVCAPCNMLEQSPPDRQRMLEWDPQAAKSVLNGSRVTNPTCER